MKVTNIKILRLKAMWAGTEMPYESLSFYTDIAEPEFFQSPFPRTLMWFVQANDGEGEKWAREHFPDAEIEILDARGD